MTEPLERPERTADENDRATYLEMETLDAAVQAAQRRARQAQLPLPDGSYAVTDCEECGEEIGEARLRVASMNKWCFDCASEHERKQRWFAR